jgi:hypothetical protein
MARLWSSGFELNSTALGVEWSFANGSIVTSPVRSGAYAGRINSLSSGSSKQFSFPFLSSNSPGPFYLRVYFRYATLPTATNTIVRMIGTSNPVRLGLTSTGRIRLLNNATQIGSDSDVLSADTWYRLEMEFNNTGGAGSGVLRARLDGTEFAATTTATLNDVRSLTLGGNLTSETETQGDWFFDDLAINDGNGSVQNSYPGEGSIVHLRPAGAGDNAADAGTFASIDEVTPNDTTDYIELDTATSVGDYTIDSPTGAGIGSGDSITLVQVGFRAREEASNSIQFAVRLKSASGGSTTQSSFVDLGSGAWVTNALTQPQNYQLTSYTDPTTSAAWTVTGTNSLTNAQIGAATGNTNDVHVTALWALVEYAPPVSSTTATVSDTVTTSESLAGYSDTVLTRESVNVAIEAQGQLTISVSDSVTLSEAVQRSVTNGVVVSESLTITENVSVSITAVSDASISVSDTTTLSEAVQRRVDNRIAVTDTATATESTTATVQTLHINSSESVTVTESIQRSVTNRVTATDTATITESVTLSITSAPATYSISVSDSATVSESVATSTTNRISVSDSTTVGESVARMLVLGIARSDSVTVTESVHRRVVNNINASESVTVSDAVTTRLSDYSLAVSDTASVVDVPIVRIQFWTSGDKSGSAVWVQGSTPTSGTISAGNTPSSSIWIPGDAE